MSHFRGYGFPDPNSGRTLKRKLEKIDFLLKKCRSISLFYRKTMLSEEGFELKEEEQIIDSENRLRFMLVEIS
jgi:hypothetical protein